MSLEHSFSVFENTEKMDTVSVPDGLITYMNDSLYWIVSLWNRKKTNNGLPYYGEATIEGEDIVKFKKILIQWRELFSLGTEEIILTGNYLVDEMKYEKIVYSKGELLEIINMLIQLCSKAEMMHTYILFEGI